MRLCGFDAAYDPGGDPDELFRRARREGRLVVSRSSSVAGRAPQEVIHVTGGKLEEQLMQVARELRRRYGRLRPLSRCSLCNRRVKRISREAAAGMVPPYVWRTQRSFTRCPSCGRIYWEATHGRDIRRRLAGVLGGHGSEDGDDAPSDEEDRARR